MWGSSNRHRIPDKLFYGTIGLLVVVLGGLGSLLIFETSREEARRIEGRIEGTLHYLIRVLPDPVDRLNAKAIREVIGGANSEELRAIEIFDDDGERVYVYERAGEALTYDHRFEEPLQAGEKEVGRFVAYFSVGTILRSFLLREFSRLIILIAAAGLVLGLGLYLLVNRMVLRPIDVALAFSRRLADGDHGQRIRVTSDDEMGRLQESLNRMADALQESVEELKTSFYEAENARRRAQEVSELKGKFLANVSHEIRTPLHAVIGYTDLLLEEESAADRREKLQTIRHNATMLLSSINDILDLSKLEAGKLRMSESEFHLADLLEELKSLVQLRLRGKPVEFHIEVTDRLEKVRGDRVGLRQVLLNLLTNATKFTDRGSILLTVQMESDDHLLFCVADSGVGISPGDQERIFEPFIQGTTREKGGYGGIGLGLSIAKRLVGMMEGRIWLESRVGQGTTFYFTSKVILLTKA